MNCPFEEVQSELEQGSITVDAARQRLGYTPLPEGAGNVRYVRNGLPPYTTRPVFDAETR